MKSVQNKFHTVVLCSLFFIVCSVSLFAWPTVNGVALCTAANSQYNSTIVTDGSGEAIITWADFRSGSNTDIYAQKVNSNGTILDPLSVPQEIWQLFP